MTTYPATDRPSLDPQNRAETITAPTELRPSSRRANYILAIVGVLAAVLVVLGVRNPVCAVSIGAAWLAVPGWAIVSQFRVRDPLLRVIFTAVAGLVVASVVGCVMLWTSTWYPTPVGAVILLASSIALGVTARMIPAADSSPSERAKVAAVPNPRRLRSFVPWIIVVVAVALWALALPLTNVNALGDWGLLAAFGPAWYVGVATVFALCIWNLSRSRIRPALMTVSGAVLVVMLYASATIVEAVPHLPWVYKHIAVTDYVDAAGRLDPSIDIYNRWPGMFAASAFLGHLTGYRDAISYAGWAEVVIALADAVLVFAIARAITSNSGSAIASRVPWTAALVFTVGNWVGQNYYSPQAFAFVLYLTMCLIAVTYLRGTPFRWVTRVEARLAGKKQAPVAVDAALIEAAPVRQRGASRRVGAPVAAIVAILVLQAVIVVSHQLTPYLAVACLLPLFLIGYFRPMWLGFGLLVIALLFLLPNVGFIQAKFGLFSGFDFFANVTYTPPYAQHVTDASQWHARGVAALSVLTVLLGFAGFVRHARNGNVRTAILVTWLACASVVSLFGQTYGGEGRFRVLLFGLPWFAIGIAWLFESGTARARRGAVLRAVALSVMAVLFVVTSLQQETDNQVPKADAAAAKWLDGQLKPNDLLMGLTGTFPSLIGKNYPILLANADKTGALSNFLVKVTVATSAKDVTAAVDRVGGAGHTYLLFADSQDRYAIAHGLIKADAIANLRQAVSASSDFQRVYNKNGVVIYSVQ